jgi:hypothetical protein
MPIGILFWGLFIIYLFFNCFWWYSGPAWNYGLRGSVGFAMILIFLLGWAEFGFILQGGRGSPFH